MLKYNFVFFGVRYDYLFPYLGNLSQHEAVRIHRECIEENPFLQTAFHYHWSCKVNQKFRMPLKSLWYPKIYQQHFNTNRPICFVFCGGGLLAYDDGLVKYIRQQNPENRIVLQHWDLIAKKFPNNYEQIHRKADLVMTYDKEEAKKYGITYYPENSYSQLIPEPAEVNFKYDVYFLANVKDRLARIMEIYHFLYGNGVKCKFLLVGVPVDKQIPLEGVEYTKGITYVENLQYVIQSRCLLELVQGKSTGMTLRAREAIAYRRKLLTDCPEITSDDFNPEQLQIINEIDHIDCQALRRHFSPADFPVRKVIDPIQRLYFIEGHLPH